MCGPLYVRGYVDMDTWICMFGQMYVRGYVEMCVHVDVDVCVVKLCHIRSHTHARIGPPKRF